MCVTVHSLSVLFLLEQFVASKSFRSSLLNRFLVKLMTTFKIFLNPVKFTENDLSLNLFHVFNTLFFFLFFSSPEPKAHKVSLKDGT